MKAPLDQKPHRQGILLQIVMPILRLSIVRSNEVTGVNIQRFRQLAQDADACGDSGTFDRADVAHADLGARRQFFLRQVLIMAYATHVDGHDLLEVHGTIGIR